MLQREPDKVEVVAKTQELLTNKLLNKALIDSLPYPAMIIRKDRRIIIANKVAKELGVEEGTYCWDTFGKRASISQEDKEYYEKHGMVLPAEIKCSFCMADEAIASQKTINEKIPADDVTYDTFWIPLTDDVYLHYAIIL